MLQYLIILLDDVATSYCHYKSNKVEKRLISPDDLRAGIIFAMKQNLKIHFVYPSYELPAEYHEAIEKIDHVKIKPANAVHTADADVLVFNSPDEFIAEKAETNREKISILRMLDLKSIEIAHCVSTRLNIIITDIETYTGEDFDAYKNWLLELTQIVAECYRKGKNPKINLLTDRISLEKMNNCNAGAENITLAPNGKFYVCPAFYYDDENDSIGAPKSGVDVKNRQLYKLAYAPLCRNCDAFQCKRCVWLNRKTTLEVNTPSHEQCVTAHIERNASACLLNELKPAGFFKNVDIPAIDYLDPFEIINQ